MLVTNEEIDAAAHQFREQFGTALYEQICRSANDNPTRESKKWFLVGLTTGFNNAIRVVRNATEETTKDN